MLNLIINHSFQLRPPIAILGVPFDNVTLDQTVSLIDGMIASRRPHYIVTANVDFVTQAQSDPELRRIFVNAHMVLCDGTPLVWASRFLGNPLPERVAGSDIVPRLMALAAKRGHRIFLLGATEDSAKEAVTRLKREHPSLKIAGHYSPPFGTLFQMDHREIRRRITAARPDMLFVAFGCPKAEKWIAMHYRSLGVPVVMGIGATIDFLAGKVKRAPRWTHRTGLEWLYRLSQEPGRLAGRYAKDLWVFGRRIWVQWARLRKRASAASQSMQVETVQVNSSDQTIGSVARLQGCLDASAAQWFDSIAASGGYCVLDLSGVNGTDSTGVALLLRLRTRIRAAGRELVLAAPRRNVLRALALMNLQDFFPWAQDVAAAQRMAEARSRENQLASRAVGFDTERAVEWPEEITASNVRWVMARTRKIANLMATDPGFSIDLSRVNFIDTAGVLLMLRLQRLARRQGRRLAFHGAQPAVREILRGANLDVLFFERPELSHLIGDAVAA
jgi:N-acetylglucosaminyldiphosphoundecaprenol N-acetyl-beta-D-mannosaminyltransferase